MHIFILFIVTLAYINCVSVRGAAYLMNACTFAKTAALLIIITGGIVNISQGECVRMSARMKHGAHWFKFLLLYHIMIILKEAC